MARLTVNSIMKQIAVSVNQEAAAPTTGGAEYSLWLEYMNRAMYEWVEANDWEVLRKTFQPSITTGGATVALPLDFKKVAGAPVLYGGQEANGDFYEEILEENKQDYSTTKKYFQILGDYSAGQHMIFNPGTLASGASLLIPYFSIPTSLASATQIPVIPDEQFMIDRTIAYIFEARSDPRFQTQEQKAREKLLNMIEAANAAKYNSYATANKVTNTTSKAGFRFGRD